MKNFLSLLLFIFASVISINAQEKVTLKAGTIVPLVSVETVRASKVNVNQTVNFRISRDVLAEGKVAIPAGTIVKGKVYEAKKSTAFGTKGRLGINISNVILPSGDLLYLTENNVYITGVNRTPISVVVFCLTLLPFPCGSKAVMPAGYEVNAAVASNTTISL